MKVYHGSIQAVEYPLVGVGCENLDFGKGFYVTDIYTQAERWGAVMALRCPGSASVVNIYELDVCVLSSPTISYAFSTNVSLTGASLSKNI